MCLFGQGAMSEDRGTDGVSSDRLPAAPASAKAEAKASTRSKRAARPKIDLDEEIRRANDLAAMSRKMLSVARQTSKNNRKAKQRLIKKAGKLSPEDLERIAVLKRCGLYQEEDEDGEDGADGSVDADSRKKTPQQSGPSEAESKRKRLGGLGEPHGSPLHLGRAWSPKSSVVFWRCLIISRWPKPRSWKEASARGSCSPPPPSCSRRSQVHGRLAEG